jgi:hypothetical protein
MFDWPVRYAKDRISKNKNLLGAFFGETGSGKTYAAMRYAQAIDKHFSIERVVFNTDEFMKVLTSGLKSGSVIVYDEVGVGHGARQWYSMANQLFNYILQTFRHRNIIVLFTTPDIGFLDKNARKLLHITFETVKIDFENNLCYCKPKLSDNSPTYDKVYRKYPRVIKDHKQVIIDRAAFGMPTPELVREYEEKKTEYTTKLGKLIKKRLKKQAEKDRVVDLNKLKDEVLANKDYYLKNYRNRIFIDDRLIRNKFNLSIQKSRELKAMVEKEMKQKDE